MRRFLALRHRLLPYLHSMNWRGHLEGIPLVRPLYHAWPDRPEAYEYPNVYEFGSQLIVAPVTAPGAGEKRAAEVRLWLPDGLWYDFFTDEVYEGGRRRHTALSARTHPRFRPFRRDSPNAGAGLHGRFTGAHNFARLARSRPLQAVRG